jgi:hypothetical protein
MLQGDWLLVAKMVDALNIAVENRGFRRTQIVLGRNELDPRVVTPHTKQAAPREPASGFDHQDAPPIDHAQPEHHRRCRGSGVRSMRRRSSSSRVRA